MSFKIQSNLHSSLIDNAKDRILKLFRSSINIHRKSVSEVSVTDTILSNEDEKNDIEFLNHSLIDAKIHVDYDDNLSSIVKDTQN